MVSSIEVVIHLSLVVILPVFFLYLSTWMHEFGHLLFIILLGYQPIAILCSKKGVALAVARESIEDRKHETIVALAGLLGGLFAMMLFSLVLTFGFGFWYGGFLGLLLGLINAVFSSVVDFRYLSLIRKYPVKEREKKHLGDTRMKKLAKVSSWSIAIVLSRKRWPRWKKKQEKLFGEKINVREVAFN